MCKNHTVICNQKLLFKEPSSSTKSTFNFVKSKELEITLSAKELWPSVQSFTSPFLGSKPKMALPRLSNQLLLLPISFYLMVLYLTQTPEAVEKNQNIINYKLASIYDKMIFVIQ